jgi:hypothetical protein
MEISEAEGTTYEEANKEARMAKAIKMAKTENTQG